MEIIISLCNYNEIMKEKEMSSVRQEQPHRREKGLWRLLFLSCKHYCTSTQKAMSYGPT